jgi:hypothetical protein
LVVFALYFVSCAFSQAQTFSSGSTGADGALNLATPGIIYFDPKSFTPPLNPAGDNIFNFTTINIAQGVTVKLSSKFLTGPVFWLATGTVTINGTIDLNGEPGLTASTNQSDRVPAAGGAGGYGGGIGGYGAAGSPNLPVAQPGNGPGGGAAGLIGTSNSRGYDGSFTGNQYLVPLVGGSGGGGGNLNSTGTWGGGGGGGGGAILIASSTSITLNASGSISANGASGGNSSCGSNGGCGGGGSGGAIRLMANTIVLNSSVQASGGLSSFGGSASPGRIRFESFQFTNPGSGGAGPVYSSSVPFAIALPATAPGSLKVTSVAGIPINANPFSFPDATINSSSPINVNIQAQFVPPGTVPKLIVFSETGADQTIVCTPLQGTLQSSTSTASITLPPGGSRGFVKATW